MIDVFVSSRFARLTPQPMGDLNGGLITRPRPPGAPGAGKANHKTMDINGAAPEVRLRTGKLPCRFSKAPTASRRSSVSLAGPDRDRVC